MNTQADLLTAVYTIGSLNEDGSLSVYATFNASSFGVDEVTAKKMAEALRAVVESMAGKRLYMINRQDAPDTIDLD